MNKRVKMDSVENEFGQLIGYSVSDWQGARFPDGGPLTGKYCKLVPLDINKHGNDLYESLCEPFKFSDWTYLPKPEKPFENKKEFISYLKVISSDIDPCQYAIIDRVSGKAIGTVALMRIDQSNGVIEIGYVTFSNQLKKTRMATEAIYLLINYSFEKLGYRRVEWKCNNLNEASKKSALRFGFKFEGVFRQAAVVKGHNRDTAWFSMLDYEFHSIKNDFDNWLSESNFYANGEQINPLRVKSEI